MTDDPGIAAVEVVRERLGVDHDWCVDYDRGFTWWAHDLAQSVWSENAVDDDGIVIWRLHSRTDLARRVSRGPQIGELLSRLNALSPMSGPAFHATEPETLQLVSSAYLHDESAEWVVPLFQLATGLQVAGAHALATALSDALGAERAASSHPEHGERAQPDEMLDVVAALPLREGGSRFAGPELETLGRYLLGGSSVRATSGRDGLTAEFPFGGTTSMLRIETREPHPQLGSGVRLVLALPTVALDHDPSNQAMELNGLEMRDLTRAHLLGGWCLTPDEAPLLAFHAFVPNVAYRPGILTNLALSMAVRAGWVDRQVGAGRPTSTPHGQPPLDARQPEGTAEPMELSPTPPPRELTLAERASLRRMIERTRGRRSDAEVDAMLALVADEGGLPSPLMQEVDFPLPRGDDLYLPPSFRGYTRMLAFDTLRLNAIKGMLDSGLVERVDSPEGVPCVMFALDTLQAGIRRDDKAAVESFFSGALPFRGLLTRSGRVQRQVWKSMRAEWRDMGRLRMSLLEVEPIETGIEVVRSRPVKALLAVEADANADANAIEDSLPAPDPNDPGCVDFVYLDQGGSKIGLEYRGRLYDSIENPREFSLLVKAADALGGFDMYVPEERRAQLAAELGLDA